MNNFQKIFLICGFINLVATLLFYIETDNFVLHVTGYNKTKTEEQIKIENPGKNDRWYRLYYPTELRYPSGEFVKTGYGIDWKTAIPFHLLILSGISFFLFKDK